ncbi:transketolase [Actinocrinis puniceicyclus]|uniref:Transketolase n=1 Tax=Actinocrinis puniceicyclus TaxID=977794 RepID=A0A8J7WKZ2_9ACTN|nr:transketolase [Actinocrinis puniceicyclus]MBS2961429.1 transketolase [Actinocrinis puniceicyclus]
MNAIGSDLPMVGPAADRAALYALGRQLRVDAVRASTAAGSGHPTSSMSAADLMAVLMARHLRYDWDEPDNPANDHLILSKGHASPLLYAMYRAAGVISEEELLDTYRRSGRLQGHPTPVLPWVDVATGSLGQGIGYGVGIALAGRKLDRLPYRVWVLCGDGEMAEGSVWEALDKAAHYGLANFTAIIDVNRLGQTGATEFGWDTERYAHRVTAFGCRALTIDGHDADEITAAYEAVTLADRPTVVIARTVKGSGFAEIEDKPGWHGKPLPEDMARRAVGELGGVSAIRARGPLPDAVTPPRVPVGAARPRQPIEAPRFELGEQVATRKAYGRALAALGARPDVVALDGEVGNSTYGEDFEKEHADRYFQMYIAEQQMIATAVGFSVRGYRPFAATFAAFLTRAHDFLRMASISQADVCVVGSHCGVEIGADGPSQMGLEDIAMMRSVHGSTVLYPSDATSAAALTLTMADLPGISYLRTTRGAYPVLYRPDERFQVGGCKVWGESPQDVVTLVGAGVTLHECLEAATRLSQQGIATRVVDLYSVKPLDEASLRRCAEQTRLLMVVEDHHPEGGIGEAVAAVLARRGTAPGAARFAHLAVDSLPGSASTAAALDAAGISAAHIVQAARAFLERDERPGGKPTPRSE